MTVAPPLPNRQASRQMFEMTPGTEAPKSRINAVIYGDSGVGKTVLGTSLPWGTERWGDESIYVAWDAGSETLLSVSPEDRKHLTIVTPKLARGDSDRMVLNPYKASTDIASADWATLRPNAKTLIWDGASRLAEQILRAVANTGATVSKSRKEEGNEGRLTFGERGEASFMAQPIIPDYGMAQHAILQWAEMLRQQPLNIIVICVSDYYKPEGGSLDGDTVGGPSTVGTKIIPKFMKDFDNVFRISMENDTVKVEEKDEQGKPKPPRFERKLKRYLWTEKNGIWAAKIRRPPSAVNPLARVELTPNAREFWNMFDTSGMGI